MTVLADADTDQVDSASEATSDPSQKKTTTKKQSLNTPLCSTGTRSVLVLKHDKGNEKPPVLKKHKQSKRIN